MLGETKKRWMILCQQAANEQDPQRLLELVREINDILEAEELALLEAKERKLKMLLEKVDNTPAPSELE